MADIIVFLAFLESSADGIPFTRASSVLHWHIILDVDCGVVFWFWRGVWTIHLFSSRWCRKPHPKVCLVAEDVLRSFLKSTFVPLTKCPFLFPMLLLVWSFIEHPSKWLVCMYHCLLLPLGMQTGEDCNFGGFIQFRYHRPRAGFGRLLPLPKLFQDWYFIMSTLKKFQ